MAGAVRQFKYVDNSASGTQNWTGALDSNVLAGSLIVVGYAAYGTSADPTSISDNLNGAYTKDVVSPQDSNSGDIIWMYSVPNSAAGALTVSFGGNAGWLQAGIIIEITGATTASPKDASNSGVGVNSSTPPSFTLTTVTDHDIIIAVCGYYNTTPTITPGSGLTLIQNDIQSTAGHRMASMKIEDAGAAAGNPITYTYVGTGNQGNAMAAVAYKIPSSTPTPGVGAGTLTGVAGRMDRGVFTRTTIKGQT